MAIATPAGQIKKSKTASASHRIYINGKFYDKADAKISVYDHGLLYGDGVFEGIRIYEGKVFRLREHINRLYEGGNSIRLEIPMNREQMIDAVLVILDMTVEHRRVRFQADLVSKLGRLQPLIAVDFVIADDVPDTVGEDFGAASRQ